MTSDSDDLEQQLRENLKLRLELAAEVAKAKKRKTGRLGMEAVKVRGSGRAYRVNSLRCVANN